jgi:hypothetical protein
VRMHEDRERLGLPGPPPPLQVPQFRIHA